MRSVGISASSRRRGGGTFNILDLAPTGWWAADEISGLSDGDNIVSVPDLSGNGNAATPVSTAPVYKTNIQNGLPAIRFVHGTTGALSSAATVSSEFQTVVAAIIPNSASTYRTIRGSNTSGGLQVRLTTGNVVELLKQAVASIGSGTTTVTVDTPHIVSATVTGSENPVYAASASSYYNATTLPDTAVNGDGETSVWLSAAGTTQWFQIEPVTPWAATSLSITCRSGRTTYMPKDFTIEGSLNGTDWTVLSTQTGVTDWVGSATKEFTFSNSTSWAYWLINITASNGASYSEIAETWLDTTQGSMVESTWSIRVDGASDASDTKTDSNFSAATTYIGYNGSKTDETFGGDILELVQWDGTALSGAETAAVEAELMSKWGIT